MANLLRLDTGKMFSAISTLARDSVVTDEMFDLLQADKTDRIGRLVREAIVGACREAQTLVTVPAETSRELIRWVQKEFERADLRLGGASSYPDATNGAHLLKEGWEFMWSAGRKTFKVLQVSGDEIYPSGMDTVAPIHRKITRDQVRTYFNERGFHGNIGAFVSWVGTYKPEGEYLTIPEEGELFHENVKMMDKSDREYLLAAHYRRRGYEVMLKPLNVANPLYSGEYTFVGFQEVTL